MKRLIHLIALLGLLGLWSGTARAWPLAIPNPSFEQADPQRPDQPLGYGTYSSPGTTATFKWDKSTARTGQASLYIKNDGPQTALWSLSAGVQCVPQVKCVIRVWVKTREATGFTGLSLRYRDANNQWASPPIQSSERVQGTSDWQQVAFIADPPLGATNFVVFMANTRTQGAEAWFDDLSVEETLDMTVRDKLPPMLQQVEKVLNMPASAVFGLDKLQRDPLRQWQSRGQALLKRVESSAPQLPSAQERADMAQQWAALSREFRAVERDVALAATVGEWAVRRNEKSPRYVVGWQNTLTRVWLRDLSANWRMTDVGHLDMMKGETEGIQLVIAAVGGALSKVKVTVGDLAGSSGRIPATSITAHPIGFVHLDKPQTPIVHPVEAMYIGWWPEILLDPFEFDVSKGDTQPVWLSVTMPRAAKPGVYTAPVEVAPANAPAVKLTLEVKVWDCELPRAWHLRSIMSFHDGWARKFYESAWTPALRQKFLDFLVARRINLTSMYGDTDFTWDELMKAVEAGQNTILVYTIPSNAGLGKPPTAPPWIDEKMLAATCKKLDEWCPKLKQAGLLDKALFYGFDEVHKEWFEAARRVFRIIKERYGIQTFSTLQDASYGLDTGLTGLVDNFSPLIQLYDRPQARKARAAGAKVWWYETDWNIEQRLTRSRLIPWQTFKVEADGFLIWCINRWRGGDKLGLPKSQWKWNTQPVANQILNEWNPWLDGGTPNSTANYLYPGASGPLSSTRLENFRDGVEEYDLLCEARQRLSQLKATRGDAAKVAALEKALTIEDSFIKSGLEADHRPETLLAHRLRLIEAMAQTQ